MSDACPYCFEAFNPRWAAFRCTNPDPAECPPVEDDALKYFQRSARSPRLPRITIQKVPRWRRPPSSIRCTECLQRTTKIVCDHCHNQLPSQYRAVSGRSIAMVGAKASGKSHLVAVLINQLQSGASVHSGQPLTLQALDDETIRRYDTEFRRRLFEEQRVLEATRTVGSNQSLRYPLAYQLKVGRDKLKILNLVFFDTAGEDLESREMLDRDARYVAGSDAVIMLLDPLQLPAVRERLKDSMSLPAPGGNPLDLVTRVTDAVRLRLELPPHRRIDRPLALAFSKMDAVRSLMDQSSRALAAPSYEKGFDAVDADEVSESVRSHVHTWAGPELESFVSANWSTYRWFGLSALGRPPEGTELAAGISPLRVEDPLFWFLASWKLVPSRGRRGR